MILKEAMLPTDVTMLQINLYKSSPKWNAKMFRSKPERVLLSFIVFE